MGVAFVVPQEGPMWTHAAHAVPWLHSGPPRVPMIHKPEEAWGVGFVKRRLERRAVFLSRPIRIWEALHA